MGMLAPQNMSFYVGNDLRGGSDQDVLFPHLSASRTATLNPQASLQPAPAGAGNTQDGPRRHL